jgi:hypothetical protein
MKLRVCLPVLLVISAASFALEPEVVVTAEDIAKSLQQSLVFSSPR